MYIIASGIKIRVRKYYILRVSRKLWGRGVCLGGIFFYKHFAPPERGQFGIRDLVVKENVGGG